MTNMTTTLEILRDSERYLYNLGNLRLFLHIKENFPDSTVIDLTERLASHRATIHDPTILEFITKEFTPKELKDFYIKNNLIQDEKI